MSILKIARMGHPVLRRPADPVADPTAPEVRRLVADMWETLADTVAGKLGLKGASQKAKAAAPATKAGKAASPKRAKTAAPARGKAAKSKGPRGAVPVRKGKASSKGKARPKARKTASRAKRR